MSPLALALVLVAALCHAVWNLAAKKAGGGNHFVLMGSLLVTVLWAPLVLWLGVQGMAHWGWLEWGLLASSAVVHVFYFRTLLHGYQVSDLTVVYPVARGSGPLLASVGAVIVLGETLSLVSGAGALAVVCGVFLIAGGPGLWRRAQDPAQRDRVRRGIGWGALTGGFIAAYTVIDGYAVKVVLISPILVDYVGNVLRVPVMAPFALRDPAGFVRACRAQWRPALVIAILGPTSYVLVLYAVTMAPLSHVAPAREVSMLFAALLGGTLLGEGDRMLRLLGAACIALGVAGLAIG
ncbi:EamA family transporter [Piscinibacter sp.]|uniref:EamA family transporter n=1 Tax=Piscinibacter sp. TaxID=1903157 RepID=UPI002C7078B0|nr:EamA family transporter [Albitalea sp.]HUG23559.1 EamA family transporter [Albitalea sp.]